MMLPNFERVADDGEHFVVLEWLGHVVEGAVLHRRDRAFDRGVRRDDEDREIFIDAFQFVERLDAVQSRHHDVDDRRVKGQRPGKREPVLTRRSEPHLVALPRQQRLEDVAHDLLVVDDEDGAVLGSGHGALPLRAR